MTKVIEAIFSKGVLTPVEPLALREQERVQITITTKSADRSAGEKPAVRRMVAGFDKMKLHTGGRLPTREELHERR